MVTDHDKLRLIRKHWDRQYDKFENTIFSKIAETFNTTLKDHTYWSLYELSDMLWAEQFHGIPKRYNFTQEEWELVKQVQLDTNWHMLSQEMRRTLFSRFFGPVLNLMKQKVGLEYDSKHIENHSNVRFIMYSTHDNQLSCVQQFMNAKNIQPKWIDYGSNFLFELHQKDTSE